MRTKKKIGLLILFVLFLFQGITQDLKPHKPRFVNTNLPNFDLNKYHFGFTLGLNYSDFVITRTPNLESDDSLFALNNITMPGFDLGIVATYRINKNFRLRFVPTLSFQDRLLEYDFFRSDSTLLSDKRLVESTFVILPFFIKLRTDRIGNFAAYIISGTRFMIDMSSKKKNAGDLESDDLVRVKKYQMGVDFGGGFDFFLQYFKFGIELKMGVGVHNILEREDHKFSSPLEKLIPKTYQITLTFEG